jgi:glucose/arabinose dehydrogenase
MAREAVAVYRQLPGRAPANPEYALWLLRACEAARDTATGLAFTVQLLEAEPPLKPPQGGDEINIMRAGRNYGWPIISYGKDYSRALITPFTSYAGMEQPVLHWTPSIAPAGMTLYDGELFPQWRGSLFVAALAEESVRRVPMLAGGEPGKQDTLFKELGQRIRDIRTGPDGALYLVTDEPDGQLIRVVPSR